MIAARAILLAFLAMAAGATSLQAQPYDSHWQAAMMASSARFKLFALMAQRPDGAEQTVAALQQAQGFDHKQGHGPQILSSGLRFGPVLRFDDNINGGTPGETIMIGGLPFAISPASRAVSGVVWGGAASGNLRLSLSPATTLDASLSASRSQGQGARITTQSAALCLGQFMGGTDWLDICLQHDLADRALSNNDQTTASISLTHQFATDFALSEVQMKLRQSVLKDYRKLSLDMGLTTARAQWGLVQTQVELGQYIAGKHTRLFGATLSLTRPIFGAETMIFASYSREGGAAFFGDPRWDQVVSLGLSRPINDVLGLNLSVQDRQSTLANYDGVTFGLDFTFDALTF